MTSVTGSSPSSPVSPSPPPPSASPNRLYQAAAWVAIVAGVLFIVGAVSLTGCALGRDSGCDGPRHRMGPPAGMQMMPMGPGTGPGVGPQRPTPPGPAQAPPPSS